MIFLCFILVLLPFYHAPVVEAALPSFNLSTLKNVIYGVGKRMGINWNNTTLGAIVGYIAGKSDLVLPQWELFGTVPDSKPLDSNIDWSQYLLSPDDFNKNAQSIQDAFNNLGLGTLEYYYCGDVPATNLTTVLGSNYSLYSPYFAWTSTAGNYDFLATQNDLKSWYATIDSTHTDQVDLHLVFNTLSSTHLYYSYSGLNGFSSANTSTFTTSNVVSSVVSMVGNGFDGKCARVVPVGSQPDISNIQNTTVWTTINNATVDGTATTSSVPLFIKSDNSVPSDTEITGDTYNAPLSVSDITNIYNGSYTLPADSGSNPPTTVSDDTHSILGYVSDMYNGMVSFMGNAVDDLKSVSAGSVGLVSFLTDFFSWLPSPIVTLFMGAFSIGFVAYFFRR